MCSLFGEAGSELWEVVTKVTQYFWGDGSKLWEAIGKKCVELGGWPVGHPCAIFELRGMLGS